jgi:hypothetical protein
MILLLNFNEIFAILNTKNVNGSLKDIIKEMWNVQNTTIFTQYINIVTLYSLRILFKYI